MQQTPIGLKQYAELKIARDGQIARERANALEAAKARALNRENDMMLQINGVSQMGPGFVVRQNAAIAQEQYNDALAARITGGPFSAGGYLLGGDESAFKWSVADGVMTSFGGIPAEGASVLPRQTGTQPVKSVAYYGVRANRFFGKIDPLVRSTAEAIETAMPKFCFISRETNTKPDNEETSNRL